jgi:hypothetical protein
MSSISATSKSGAQKPAAGTPVTSISPASTMQINDSAYTEGGRHPHDIRDQVTWKHAGETLHGICTRYVSYERGEKEALSLKRPSLNVFLGWKAIG